MTNPTEIEKIKVDILKCANFLVNCREYFQELPNDEGLLATARELYFLIKELQ